MCTGQRTLLGVHVLLIIAFNATRLSIVSAAMDQDIADLFLDRARDEIAHMRCLIGELEALQ